MTALDLQVVLPIHQEADTIAATIAEWSATLVALGVSAQIVACEDGSTDATRQILEGLVEPHGLLLLAGAERKGYSRAVVDGLRATSATWVCCADGDGQCDPAGLHDLWTRRAATSVIVGARTPRRDPWARRAQSRSFGVAFRLLHGIRLDDPSSPFCLMPGSVAHAVAATDPVLAQGYWWEFHVRRAAMGVDAIEVPVAHRARPDGGTRVYTLRRLPTIAAVHLRGIWQLRQVRSATDPGVPTDPTTPADVP